MPVVMFAGAVAGFGAGLGGCGSDKKPAPNACTVNSDCNDPLVCTFGKCQAACREARDCMVGQQCVKGMGAFNVCLLANIEKCTYNSDCPAPLICARDFKCRNQCQTDRDCATASQKCLQPDLVCAEPDAIDPATGTLRTTDAGVPGGPLADGGAGSGDGGAGSGADVVPAMPGTEPVIDAVTVTPTPIVRQGEAGITISISGRNLAGARDVRLGDVVVAVQPGATASALTMTASVPHGAVLGGRELVLTTPTGTVRKPNAITISAITASHMGTDAMGRGNHSSPFRTLGKAAEVAASGDIIQLIDGKYEKNTGEKFPITIPDGVTLVGQTTAGTQIIGSALGNEYTNGLVFAGSATVRRLSINNFGASLVVDRAGAKLKVEDVYMNGQGGFGAIVIDTPGVGAEVILSGQRVVLTTGNAPAIQIKAMDASFTAMGTGELDSLDVSGPGASVSLTGFGFRTLKVTSDASVKIDRATVSVAIAVTGAGSTLEILDSVMMFSSDPGIDFGGDTLKLERNMIGHGNTGIKQTAGKATVRGTTFNTGGAPYILEGGSADFGTAASKGDNTLVSRAAAVWYPFMDERANSGPPTTFSGTTLNGEKPPAGTVTAGPARHIVAGRYTIRTPGNAIIFAE